MDKLSKIKMDQLSKIKRITKELENVYTEMLEEIIYNETWNLIDVQADYITLELEYEIKTYFNYWLRYFESFLEDNKASDMIAKEINDKNKNKVLVSPEDVSDFSIVYDEDKDCYIVGVTCYINLDAINKEFLNAFKIKCKNNTMIKIDFNIEQTNNEIKRYKDILKSYKILSNNLE